MSRLLDWRRANQALFIMPPWHYPDGIKARVIALRDEYEKIFTELIDDLPCAGNRSPLSASHDDRCPVSPASIAKQILSMLRAGIDDTR